MAKVIFWSLASFSCWAALSTGHPLRISPDEFQHLEEVENISRPKPTRTNEGKNQEPKELSVEENVRRMQANRIRAKQNRREMIKQQIETMLNIKGKDMPSVEEEFGSGELSQDNAAKEVIGKVMQNLPEDTRYEQFENEHLIHDHGARYSEYTEKLQSLYPECNHTDNVAPVNEVLSEILSKGHVMHMIFALKQKSPQNQEDYITEVLSGRLRLFQKEFISSPMTSNNQTEELKDVPNNMGQDVNLRSMESFQDENDTSVDTDLQTLRVIVSWIQNNSTTVLDSKTIPRQTPRGGTWVSFDILEAVKAWSNNANDNHGIIIEIETMSTSLSTDSVFRAMNCSDSARHPFPSVLENLSREIIDDLQVQEENSAIYSESLNTNMYPMLDMCTVEIPKAEFAKFPSIDMPLIPIINFGNINDFNKTGHFSFNSSTNQYISSRIHSLQGNNKLQPRNLLIEWKVPTDLADIQPHSFSSGVQISHKKNFLQSKNKLNGFQTLPKLENISYSSLVEENDDLSEYHQQRTKVLNSRRRKGKGGRRKPRNHHKKSRNHRNKGKNQRRHNRRHDPLMLRDIANDQPVSSDGSSNFTPYAPIIEQVKLTNEELKQIIKMQQKNIDQELKLLQEISNPDSRRSNPTNDS